MSQSFKKFLVYLVPTVCAYLFCLLWTAGSVVDEELYVPMGPDGFLHARRILDTYENPENFYEWDTKSFAPDGAYISWPWVYDYTIARVLRLVVPEGENPMKTLVFLPTLWVGINSLLLFLICGRLRMGLFSTALVMFGFAFSTPTQWLHGVGRIDHHFMEYTFVVATLYFTLRLIQVPSLSMAMLLGVCLALAQGVNNGLFILQLPVLCTLALLWLKKNPLPTRQAAQLGATLVVCVMLIAGFSEPLQNGMFKFYLLSWFHVYVAVITAVAVVSICFLPANKKNVIVLSVVFLVLVAPLIDEIYVASTFLRGQETLKGISEMQSPIVYLNSIYNPYTWLVVFAPLTLLMGIYYCFKGNRGDLVALSVFSIFGLLLLSLQIRLYYFGGFALLIPVFYMLEHWLKRYETKRRFSISCICSLVFALTTIHTVILMLAFPPKGWSANYEDSIPLFLELQTQCKTDPGIVLAPMNMGHYVRFHSNCSVIGNVMQGFDPSQTNHLIRAVVTLQSAKPEDILKKEVNIKYVLAINHIQMVPTGEDPVKMLNSGLYKALLNDEADIPDGFELLHTVMASEDKVESRLFKVVRNNE